MLMTLADYTVGSDPSHTNGWERGLVQLHYWQ
jgi:hypothetical protein